MIYANKIVGLVCSTKEKAISEANLLAKKSCGIDRIIVDYDDDEVTLRDEYNYYFYIRVYKTKIL